MFASQLAGQLQSSLDVAYRIERELGGGAMARVFLATDSNLDRQVAVKVLSPETTEEMTRSWGAVPHNGRQVPRWAPVRAAARLHDAPVRPAKLHRSRRRTRLSFIL